MAKILKGNGRFRVRHHKDAHLLDKNFSEWHDHMICKGHKDWDTCDKMLCNHMDPCKEGKSPDPVGPSLEYMKYSSIFDPKKTNKYDLCCCYEVGLLWDLPTFPSPCEPATREQVRKFLLKARALVHPNLIKAHVQDSGTAIVSSARTACQGQSLASANGAQGGLWWEIYQEAVLLPILHVLRQQ